MSIKKAVPVSVQKLFNKPQFKVGDVVKFTWLRDIKTGHIIKINKVQDEIRYSVKSNGVVYPCGIQIKTYTTKQTTAGLVQLESTNEYQEYIRKGSSADKPVSSNSTPTATNTRDSNRSNLSKPSNEISNSRKRSGTTSSKNNVKSSATRSNSKHKKTTKITLNKFIKNS